MSKPRDNWRPYVINVLKDYLAYRRIDRDAHSQRVTAQYNKGGRGGSGVSRSAEAAALRSGLTKQQQREYEAVERALKRTRSGPDGKERVRAVELVYFRRSHTIEGAAQQLHVSYMTAWKWTDSFIRLVAMYLDLE